MSNLFNKQAMSTIAYGALGGMLVLLVAVFSIIAFYPQLSKELDSSQKEQGIISTNSQEIPQTQASIPDVVKRVSPSVVAIVLTKEVPTYRNVYEDRAYDPFADIFGMPSPFEQLFREPKREQTGTEEIEIGGGTGFLISSDGYIVTNKHVVEEEDVSYTVITDGGEEYEAKIIAKDPVFDIAVIKIEAMDLPYLSFGNSDELDVGQTAIAIGNALAEFRNTVSVGVISGLSRSINAENGRGGTEHLEGLIQTDAAINPGNSGGPLLNSNGEVIGVNVAMSGAENIGFALPGNMVRSVAEAVKENGKIARPFLGIRYIPIDESLQKKNNLSVDYGVLVYRGTLSDELAVMPGSSADKADIKENDIILEIDGERIDEEHSLASIIRLKKPGDEITITILKKGKEEKIKAVLDEYPE